MWRLCVCFSRLQPRHRNRSWRHWFAWLPAFCSFGGLLERACPSLTHTPSMLPSAGSDYQRRSWQDHLPLRWITVLAKQSAFQQFLFVLNFDLLTWCKNLTKLVSYSYIWNIKGRVCVGVRENERMLIQLYYHVVTLMKRNKEKWTVVGTNIICMYTAYAR